MRASDGGRGALCNQMQPHYSLTPRVCVFTPVTRRCREHLVSSISARLRVHAVLFLVFKKARHARPDAREDAAWTSRFDKLPELGLRQPASVGQRRQHRHGLVLRPKAESISFCRAQAACNLRGVLARWSPSGIWVAGLHGLPVAAFSVRACEFMEVSSRLQSALVSVKSAADRRSQSSRRAPS